MDICLVDAAIVSRFLPFLQKRLAGRVKLRLEAKAAGIISGTSVGAADFNTEFLDYIVAVVMVNGVADAVTHIACTRPLTPTISFPKTAKLLPSLR